MENLYLNDLCRGNDNQDCLRETTAKAKRDWIGIVNKIAELREGQSVIFRVLIWGDWIYPAYYGDKVTPQQVAVMAPYFHEYQSLQASTPGIQTALIFLQEYDIVKREYLQEDGLHLSDAGSAAAVDLMRGLRYEPAVLGEIMDLTVTFNETGCAASALGEDVPSPIYIRVENPTSGDNALVIFTLDDGYGAQDILDFKGDGLPSFAADLVSHLTPGANSSAFYEVVLMDDRENFLVCAQDGVGALAVPLILKP